MQARYSNQLELVDGNNFLAPVEIVVAHLDGSVVGLPLHAVVGGHVAHPVQENKSHFRFVLWLQVKEIALFCEVDLDVSFFFKHFMENLIHCAVFGVVSCLHVFADQFIRVDPNFWSSAESGVALSSWWFVLNCAFFFKFLV